MRLFFEYLIAKLEWHFSNKKSEREFRQMTNASGDKSPKTAFDNHHQGFEEDYKAAAVLLKRRLNESYPDNFHARLGNRSNDARDHGSERAQAVDTASAAIALALRNGATVWEAAEAGAASVGI